MTGARSIQRIAQQLCATFHSQRQTQAPACTSLGQHAFSACRQMWWSRRCAWSSMHAETSCGAWNMSSAMAVSSARHACTSTSSHTHTMQQSAAGCTCATCTAHATSAACSASGSSSHGTVPNSMLRSNNIETQRPGQLHAQHFPHCHSSLAADLDSSTTSHLAPSASSCHESATTACVPLQQLQLAKHEKNLHLQHQHRLWSQKPLPPLHHILEQSTDLYRTAYRGMHRPLAAVQQQQQYGTIAINATAKPQTLDDLVRKHRGIQTGACQAWYPNT